uniref:Uncharacterized protein n=1 Tax=Brassica campestris TaxID=3711 RepID=A0A3P5ZZJ2_BRACM|nr:unnamed protein product [Brassica rapa]
MDLYLLLVIAATLLCSRIFSFVYGKFRVQENKIIASSRASTEQMSGNPFSVILSRSLGAKESTCSLITRSQEESLSDLSSRRQSKDQELRLCCSRKDTLLPLGVLTS